MQRLLDGSLRFSPRDLIAYLEGDFAAWCERNRVEMAGHRSGAPENTVRFEPDGEDEELALAARRGLAHEAAHLARLRSQEPGLVEIPRDATAYTATLAAMRAGAPILFQAELQSDSWMGIADFLHRVDGNSTLGDFYYEPWDTKLARSIKPYFVVQLCAYAHMLEHLQGRRPERLGFVLGDGSEAWLRTEDFWHYYRRLRSSFESFQASWQPDRHPDPSLDRNHGRWSEAARQYLERVNDLSLVAGISHSQMVRLRAAGITTVRELAAATDVAVARLSPDRLESLRDQAAMQVATEASGHVHWRRRTPDPLKPRRGLALLPPACPDDVFFDIEGFPYAPGGLEYLLGVVTVDHGTPAFRDWWAHDEAQERRAFEAFMDWAYARWQSNPAMHIYHYAAYERTALGRLMGKYATREFEVDELLRHHVLVDLYPVVHQGMVIGTPSYSLKDVEHLYMPPREGEVTSAGGSVIEYQRWLDSDESADPAASPILDRIKQYNRVDCESTVGLRDWLLARQAEAAITWISPSVAADAPPTPYQQSPAELLAATLLARVDAAPDGSETQRITRLLAWLLEFHRREEKPWWWRYFERLDATDAQLYEDPDCLAGLVRTSKPPRPVKRSMAFEYRFDVEQDTKLTAGTQVAIAGTLGDRCTIEQIDRDTGLIELKVGSGVLPDRASILDANLISSQALRTAILGFVEAWAAKEPNDSAVMDLLTRRAPRLAGEAEPFLFDDTGDILAQATQTVRRLDRSTLCIQGPPGTGKTTAAADIILSLLSDGKRVGIVANSHQVVLNLLARIATTGDERGVNPTLYKVGGEDDHPLIQSGRIAAIASKDAGGIVGRQAFAMGGTAWLFCRPELIGTLDYLFIEEAGQFSLANAVAVGASATNLILLGDQMQLAQPTQGSHPGESGKSALDYMLQGKATVPPDLGVFLGLSYRMHPTICRLVSDAYYDSRLFSAPLTHANRVIGASTSAAGKDAGVSFIAVAHSGCTQESEEEVRVIEALVGQLLRCRVAVSGKPERAMTANDILIVAPFNMQVRALLQQLGPGARVGTVDKFQGQEAPVVIVSMCASTLEDAPRGPDFLLSPNRLNVALSRAQALSVVVGSPQLSNGRARSLSDMRLANGWCRIEAQGS